MEGSTLIAKAIKAQGITLAFGVVGVPVTPLAIAMQKEGIKFIAMRNEQASSYAASCAGYLAKQPAVCLTVAGPGMVHAIGGLLNSSSNCWPLILISSAAYTGEAYQGGFQESPQIEAARPYVKYAVRVENLSRVGYHIEQAARISVYGRPGAVYVEIAREAIEGTFTGNVEDVIPCKYVDPPLVTAQHSDILKAVNLLYNSQKPLVIIGRGAAYSGAEKELVSLVESQNLPFLPSPMGKGVISDDHKLCVSAARSTAISEADVILLVGARLNWMFNYGKSFNKNVKLIQVEISMEQIHSNKISEVALVGDAKVIIEQIVKEFQGTQAKERKEWLSALQTKCEDNGKLLLQKIAPSNPMKYHFVLSTINNALPKNTILVNEGANTMDIGRLIFQNREAKSRLDAGTLGTMGVGVGYAIAAAVVFPKRKVVTVQGDSAFGFCATEVEVACRYNLPITFIILNNNGIYQGLDKLESHDPTQLIPTALTPNSHYELIMEAFGGKGYFVDSPESLPGVITEALANTKPTLVNIMIDPNGPTPSIVAAAKKTH